jgi:flagella basal body P-ring formation protein FlgA
MMGMTLIYRYGLAGAAMCFAVDAAGGATLRPFREVPGGVVRLSDLFDQMGETPDRDLGPAPAPGDRIVVEAPQLAAIARDFGVAWRPRSGAERSVLQRGGLALAQVAVMAPLRAALMAAGAPADSDIDLPGFVAPMLPSGTAPHVEIGQVSYDAVSGKFEAQLVVTAADLAPVRERLAGSVISIVEAAVLTRHMRPGTVLRTEDVRVARVHAGLLRGSTPMVAAAVIGMAMRRDVPEGQPVTATDVTRPILVARNAQVHMALDAGGISLSAQGVALEEGGLGDRVRVQNPSSRAVVLAEITAEGEVRVVPGHGHVVVAAQ